ncbi:hypothetical protein K435DRAFT_870103 [Dendrothele bispora CBS 962.96]|uniref:Uncharacterized protein n=1 Tax=Dendrothele bispora (strain CBS 962.96) TaxID=1314807 RepID=A0A4S8L7H9_DENBC|nr:hypothetical protein K435DRAFT_870103 [Dendrothele bispora CBS 962.96]
MSSLRLEKEVKLVLQRHSDSEREFMHVLTYRKRLLGQQARTLHNYLLDASKSVPPVNSVDPAAFHDAIRADFDLDAAFVIGWNLAPVARSFRPWLESYSEYKISVEFFSDKEKGMLQYISEKTEVKLRACYSGVNPPFGRASSDEDLSRKRRHI